MTLINARTHLATDTPEHLNTLQSSATPLKTEQFKLV